MSKWHGYLPQKCLFFGRRAGYCRARKCADALGGEIDIFRPKSWLSGRNDVEWVPILRSLGNGRATDCRWWWCRNRNNAGASHFDATLAATPRYFPVFLGVLLSLSTDVNVFATNKLLPSVSRNCWCFDTKTTVPNNHLTSVGGIFCIKPPTRLPNLTFSNWDTPLFCTSFGCGGYAESSIANF